MSEEESPIPKAKRRKRRGSSASDITVRDFRNGTRIFGRYTLVSILGRGGMGIVWLARDDELERQVALKFLSEQIIHDPALVADLKRETKRSLELTHPNIVRIHDFVQDARTACICMEYVNGKTLSDVRVNKPNNVFEVPDLEPLVAQWCGAMNYAHTHARVVHCDLKPTNLMLNVKGVLKITDFGIARSLSDSGSRLTVTRGKSGTLVYMSPQQLNGDPPSVFDDIYSMGATLYELLTGKPPFYRGQIDRQIFDKAPPSIAARRTELGIASPYIVPLHWEDAIAACLAKETVGRPQGALALLERLNLVSPLRVEKPSVRPKLEIADDAPPIPGEFGLMQHDAAVDSSGAQPAQRDSPVGPRRHAESIHEPRSARNVELTPAPSTLTTSIQRAMALVRDTFRRAFKILSVRDLGRFRRIVAIACVGIGSIVALWDVVSSVLRPSSRTGTNTISTTFEALSMSPSTPSDTSLPRPSVPSTEAPSSTPIVPTQSVPPMPTAEQAPTPSAVETPVPSKVPVQTPAPVPKDETTRLKNDLRAAEHAIISVHEKTTVPERLETMTSNGRAKYQKALAAFCEGYPSTAESLALEAQQAEPGQPLILNLRGLILVSKGSFDEAEASFGRAATIDQSFREVEYNFASVAFKKKDYTRSRKRFEHLSTSITPRPDDRLAQLLRYRIYLALLLEGSVDAAQHLMREMQFGAETPAPFYAHAAWEFRRGDIPNAEYWLTRARAQYAADLNLVFADALSDMGWLDTDGNVKLSSSPTAAPSATPSAPPVASTPTVLALTEITLSRIADPKAEIHLSLKIGVTPKPNTPNGHTIDIRVSYFDLTRENKLVPSNARTTYHWVTPTRNWAEATPKFLLATYVRPKMQGRSEDGRKYGGYIVRLYFDGQFQDEKASPVTLLKAYPTDNQPIAPVKSPSPIPALTPTPTLAALPSKRNNRSWHAWIDDFVRQYVRGGESNDLDLATSFFAPSVDFLDEGVKPLDSIRRDTEAYNTRWPTRRATTRGNIQISEKAPDRGYAAGFQADYYVENPARGEWINLTVSVDLQIVISDGVPRISSIKQKRLRKEEGTIQPTPPANTENLPPPPLSASGVVSITPSAATAVSPAAADPVSEIKELENKWAESITKRDAAVIGSLLADDHATVTPSGRRLDKSGVINRTKNDTDNYELVVIENMDVRVESPMQAIATGLLRERGKAKSGKSFERAFLFADTWVKRDGRWLCTQSRTRATRSAARKR